MNATQIKTALEAVLLASDRPLSATDLSRLLSDDDDRVSVREVRAGLESLMSDYDGRGAELKEVATGFRFQTHDRFSACVARLWEEKPPRYSRALLETLALIAYCQPITRGEIEAVRGVAVSTKTIRLLEDREWITELGHKEVPGRPMLYGTTKHFLDYFNLRSLKELPALPELDKVREMYPDMNVAVIPGDGGDRVAGDSDNVKEKSRETLDPEEELRGESSDNVADISG